MADREKGKYFRKAEKELAEVAKKYGFSLRLIDDIHGTWLFLPELPADWKPEDRYPVKDWQYEVANGDTVLGYIEWREHRIEAEEE